MKYLMIILACTTLTACVSTDTSAVEDRVVDKLVNRFSSEFNKLGDKAESEYEKHKKDTPDTVLIPVTLFRHTLDNAIFPQDEEFQNILNNPISTDLITQTDGTATWNGKIVVRAKDDYSETFASDFIIDFSNSRITNQRKKINDDGSEWYQCKGWDDFCNGYDAIHIDAKFDDKGVITGHATRKYKHTNRVRHTAEINGLIRQDRAVGVAHQIHEFSMGFVATPK